MGGFGEKSKVNKRKQVTEQHPSSILSKTTVLITHFPCNANLSRALKHVSEKLIIIDRKRDGGEKKRLTDGLYVPPPHSSCIHLGAAKSSMILMSSVFCNLTWEFKS